MQTPFQVPAFQQIPLVKVYGTAQGLSLLSIEVPARHFLNQSKGPLENRHVEPQISLGVELNPIGLNQQRTEAGVGWGIQGRLKLPQRFSQVLL